MVEREISAHQVLVDDEDAHLLDAYRWHVAVSSNGQRQVTHSLPGGKKVYLHRLITQAPSGMVVDHVNRNPMNNRRANLGVCRQMQNSWNRVASKSKRSTDTKGIYREKGRRGFTVEIMAYGAEFAFCARS